MEEKFNPYACFDCSKGKGRYYDGWKDALQNIVYLIDNEYSIPELERFCRQEYEIREG